MIIIPIERRTIRTNKPRFLRNHSKGPNFRRRREAAAELFYLFFGIIRRPNGGKASDAGERKGCYTSSFVWRGLAGAYGPLLGGLSIGLESSSSRGLEGCLFSGGVVTEAVEEEWIRAAWRGHDCC